MRDNIKDVAAIEAFESAVRRIELRGMRFVWYSDGGDTLSIKRGDETIRIVHFKYEANP